MKERNFQPSTQQITANKDETYNLGIQDYFNYGVKKII